MSDPDDPLVGPLAPWFAAFEWHSYGCGRPRAAPSCRGQLCPQAYRIGDAGWGIQFHAEVSAADAKKWIDEWRTDDDADRIGLDPEALRAETEAELPAWQELGRGLAGRFLEAAATRA